MSTDKIKAVQENLDETTTLLKDNIDKLLQRETKLNDIQDKTEDLEYSSIRFKVQSTRLRRQMWWNNMKLIIVVVGVALLVLGIILCIIFI